MPTDKKKHNLSKEDKTTLCLGVPFLAWCYHQKLGRSLPLCFAAKLGQQVSWIPLIPTKDKHPTVARSLLCVWQTTVANHTQHEQPCLKLLEPDVVCFVSCHLTDSYREALTHWQLTEG